MSRRKYAAWLEENLWRPSFVQGLAVPADTSPAAWIGERLTPGTFEVRMMVPEGFDAYARIFFPFARDAVLHDDSPPDVTLSWTEIAAIHERSAHALMEAETITSARDGQGRGDGLYPCFSNAQQDALWPILERHAASRGGWFLLWDGFDGLDPRPFEAQPRVEHRGRSYRLLHGPLEAHAGFADMPSYIWPEDRTWCLVTDIDFYWDYIAATAACVNDIIATTSSLRQYSMPTPPSHPTRHDPGWTPSTIPRDLSRGADSRRALRNGRYAGDPWG